MFGFSLPKIALLLLIIFVIWQIFRIIENKKHSNGSSTKYQEDKDELTEQLIECSIVEIFIVMLKKILVLCVVQKINLDDN